MPGVQGAQPKESKTATTYESMQGEENQTRTDLLSREDQGSIQMEKLQEKVHNLGTISSLPRGKGAKLS
ncbi:hypothetical protein AAZX31_03G069900 [Glycine max]